VNIDTAELSKKSLETLTRLINDGHFILAQDDPGF